MLFSQIVIGDETIRISPNSMWMVSEIQKTDADGNLSIYYKTIIKALPKEPPYGFEIGHLSEILLEDKRVFISHYEFIYFETNEKFLPISKEYNEENENNIEDDENNIKDDGNKIVTIGEILSFGKQTSKKLWKIQLYPKIVLYKFLTTKNYLKEFKRPKIQECSKNDNSSDND
jgi:hypothetical protein